MEPQEFVLALVAIVFGTVLTGYVIGKFIGLIKAWINRNNASYDEEKFERLAKAFIQHKKDTERRFKNLEAIIADDQPKAVSAPARQSGQTKEKKKERQPIEIDSHEKSDEDRDQSGSGNLRNMLKE